jgi:hypothetical protein
MADVISLVDGRSELVPEVRFAPAKVREYISTELARHRADPRFLDGVYGALPPDAASQARAELIVIPRLDELIEPEDAEGSPPPDDVTGGGAIAR